MVRKIDVTRSAASWPKTTCGPTVPPNDRVTVTSYDYQNLDRNFADVLDGATGEFKEQYGGASRTLRQLISGAKTTSKGSVLASTLAEAIPRSRVRSMRWKLLLSQRFRMSFAVCLKVMCLQVPG